MGRKIAEESLSVEVHLKPVLEVGSTSHWASSGVNVSSFSLFMALSAMYFT